jgi:RNA polymerase sigma-70 factor (ECF subfamily)
LEFHSSLLKNRIGSAPLNGDLEKELVAACRRGDISAYARLVKVYSGRIFSICMGMLANSHDAEDVAQQALLKGFASIEQLRSDMHFGAWLIRIAKNLCIDFIRKRRPRRNALVEQLETRQSGTKGYSKLRAALAELPQNHRLTLVLFYFDGRSTKSIAETLGISTGAVQARLCRARKKLRKLLEAQGDE